jgi:hypothetical protein
VTDVVLPERVDIETPDGPLVARWFQSAAALDFPRLPQAARRSVPSVVRRLFKIAAQRAEEDARCLICETHALVSTSTMVVIEGDGGFDIGVICSDSWRGRCG